MPNNTSQTFTLNNVSYDSSQLSKEGQNIFQLLREAQNELVKLETQKALLQAAQQQLINELKPFLAEIKKNQPTTPSVLGEASSEIPETDAIKPEKEPLSMPENLPQTIKKRDHN